MNKRPKSREETPKEGSDSARRYRTATICGRVAQSARAFELFPMPKTQGGVANLASQIREYFKQFNMLHRVNRLLPNCLSGRAFLLSLS
jgi:hypothetical protein